MCAILSLFIILAVIVSVLSLTLNFVGLLLTLVVAGFVGWVADEVVPGKLPFGWIGLVAAGLLGSWLGTSIFGRVGPVLADIAILPAVVGAVIVAFGAAIVFRNRKVGRA